MKNIFIALLAGILFGLGLIISEMVNPARVIGFLDITGDWDPTLAFVMGSALMITIPLFPLILRRSCPLIADNFSLPDKILLDNKLIIGACLFGLGWGLAGLCPGPAITALVTLSPDIAIFVLAMLVGNWLASHKESLVLP
jgi:uncharacterized membrane protein YedE/YeeE